MKSQKVREIIKNLAKKYNLPISEIEKIVESPFRFQAYIMKEKTNRETLEFPSVRIKNFGIFHSPDWLKEKYKEINKAKDGTIRTEGLPSDIQSTSFTP